MPKLTKPLAPKNTNKATDADEADGDKKVPLTPQQQLKAYMTQTKSDHLNYEEGDDYTISTGSLKLDIITGGIGPGLTRLVGANSGGKTSEGLELMRNFFLVRPKGRAVFYKAEGRLSKEVIERSGIKFVTKEELWDEGTCFVYEGNIYESVAGNIMNLVQNNPYKVNYFFMVDSVDGLILRDDIPKGLADSHKVAGPAVIAKKLLQKCFGPVVKFGHILVFTSQITAQPKIDPHAKTEYRSFESGGGNALKHYPDNIWEFLPRYQDHKVLQNPKLKYDQNKNPIIGHLCRIVVRKSSNEKNDVSLTYPIKYGRKDGNSIWIERELGDIISVYHVYVKGSWFEFKEDFYKELLSVDPNAPAKIQGTDKLYEYLESNPLVVSHFFKKFKDVFKQEQIWEGEGDPLAEEDEENPTVRI